MLHDKVVEIRPQKGFQEKVFGCTADIAVIGGSAGGGKTMSLIIEPLKWVHVPQFAAVFFRRTMERIRATGGLLAESKKWYVEGNLIESILKWRFPSGAEVDFEGIEYVKDLDKWMGTQIPLMVFDELTEFEEEMFWFMISRNRGIVKWEDENGVKMTLKPYVRASCNPKPDSWVSRLLSWYIDQETGYPIPERDGVIRYMINYKNKIYWGDTKDEVMESCPDVFENMFKIDPSIKPHDLIKSFTFIRGKLSDNKILTRNSPEYYSSLLSMSEEDQARFLEGNWKISADGSDLFSPIAINALFDIGTTEERVIERKDSFGRTTKSVVRDVKKHYICVDAAKFGQDLCTIYFFMDWVVMHISIFHISDAKDIYDEVEVIRRDFAVPRENVIIDQDGLGSDVVKLGKYKGFVARRKPGIDPDTRQQENYDTFKDQCYFKAAEKVNNGICKFLVTTASVRIFDRGSKKPRQSYKIKWKGDLVDIKSLIKEQLSSIKKGDTVYDGGETRYKINSKQEQKEILGGVSPDFADPLPLRASFEFEKKRKGHNKLH